MGPHGTSSLLSIEWHCRPILSNPTENHAAAAAATARRNTISDTWLISMKFTICFRCSGFPVFNTSKFLSSTHSFGNNGYRQPRQCHHNLANLFEELTCLRPKRLAVSYHKNPPNISPAGPSIRRLVLLCSLVQRDMSS